MDRIDLESLPPASLIILLKQYQKQFDAAKPGDGLNVIFKEHRRTLAELKSRGFSDEKIEWLLAQDNAPS